MFVVGVLMYHTVTKDMDVKNDLTVYFVVVATGWCVCRIISEGLTSLDSLLTETRATFASWQKRDRDQ